MSKEYARFLFGQDGESNPGGDKGPQNQNEA